MLLAVDIRRGVIVKHKARCASLFRYILIISIIVSLLILYLPNQQNPDQFYFSSLKSQSISCPRVEKESCDFFTLVEGSESSLSGPARLASRDRHSPPTSASQDGDVDRRGPPPSFRGGQASRPLDQEDNPYLSSRCCFLLLSVISSF